MKVLAKTNQLTKPSNFNLTTVNQGHTYSVELFAKELIKEEIQKMVWNAFAPFFREDV